MAEYIETQRFDVSNKSVLELGSGAGLPGLLATKMGATTVCLSDYPDLVILDNLKKNVSLNVSSQVHCRVVPHAWGEQVRDILATNFDEKFDVILMSDVLWMSDQHRNLLNTCTSTIASDGKIYLTCGIHSGWTCIDRFFDMARSCYGLEAKQIERRTVQRWEENAAKAIDDIALRNRTVLVYELWLI
ncbi:hypothetical protein INT43_006690 [Umbelopsis isabellina]|uniref:Nicotinamide N-methyltransferase n=1 Tax=Mortierella isabellina TaxID=91625 RepID=A0A8H7UJ59_MORIS|nr:hypothetical protein INT43_006690 [Umbelopsis isabellina]